MAEYALGGPAGRARIRARPADFRVVEETGYGPCGHGEHLWLDVEKRGLNTMDVAARLADCAGVPVRSVGFAGLKDRNAVTRQPFTVHLPGRADPDWRAWRDQRFRVLAAERHDRKIRRGRLAGNRFELVLRDVAGERKAIEARLARVAERGVPNAFGEQRFGGNNIARAYRLFRGELRRSPSRRKRGFYLSAARSLIFNRVVDARVRAGSWDRVIDGDVVMLDGSRSRFAADAGDPDIQRRAAELDIHPTGPLAGAGDSGVTGEAARIEQSVLDDHAELVEGLVRFRLETDRRALRMRVLDLDWRFGDNDTLALSFSLRAGCYATTVLREVVEYVDASHDT
jgi:tRNA pseudouridine13 synthase